MNDFLLIDKEMHHHPKNTQHNRKEPNGIIITVKVVVQTTQPAAKKRTNLMSEEYAWETGDIVFWDNQVTLHSREPFPADQRRLLKRISLAGSRPF